MFCCLLVFRIQLASDFAERRAALPDNMFSSLVGLRFSWQLMPLTDSSKDALPHRLVHVPLRDAPLNDCGGFCGDIDTQIELEETGGGSDLYVARGIDLGREKVTVHLAEPELEHLSDAIVLTVVEAMHLEPPSPVYVIIGTHLHHTLKVFRRNKLEGRVKLWWQAKDFMSVSHVRYHDMGIGGQAEYEVKVLKRERFTDKLEIILPPTGQKMEIDVSYEPSKFIGSNFSLEVISIVVVVSVILVVLPVIIYLQLLDKLEPARQNFGTEPAEPARQNFGTEPARQNFGTNQQSQPGRILAQSQPGK